MPTLLVIFSSGLPPAYRATEGERKQSNLLEVIDERHQHRSTIR
jgi:hypothetical protein